MAERGNDVHRRILSQFTSSDERTRGWNEEFCRSRASSIPPPTLRETTNSYHSDDENDDDGGEFIKDPTTSGRIYPKDATYVIFRFAAHLDTWRDGTSLPLFVFEEKQFDNGRSHVSCLINLPTSPIHAISATHHSSKSLAKRAACYRACLELYRRGFLDYRLYSLPSSASAESEWERIAAGRFIDRNPLLTLAEPGNKAIVSYSYQTKKPDFWGNMLTAPVTSLYPIVIMTARNKNTSQPYAPMVVLTRRPLPELHTFNLFFSGVSADIRFKACANIQLTDKQLHDLHWYTIRVCRAIANKPFTCSYESMPYFFAPLPLSWEETTQNRWSRQNILDEIPWDMVSLAVQSWVTKLPADDIDELTTALEDAVIQDRVVEFTRRYDAVKLRTDLTPLSTPFDSPVWPSSCDWIRFTEWLTARSRLHQFRRVLQSQAQWV
jgi:endoribonuclease Dicer